MRGPVAILLAATGCVASSDSLESVCAEAEDRGVAPVTASLATCGMTHDGVNLPGCDAPDGDAAVFHYWIPARGRYEVCAEAEAGTRVAVHSVCPGVTRPEGTPADTPICVDAGACAIVTYVQAGTLLLFVAGPDRDSCPILDLTITALDDGDTPETDCLDGEDNDGDRFIDCEDRGCQLGGSCDTDIALPEQCDRQDDAAVPPFAGGVIDELACRCVDDSGCDDLASGTANRHLCHPAFAGGVCAPACNLEPAWCAAKGGVCENGRCRDP